MSLTPIKWLLLFLSAVLTPAPFLSSQRLEAADTPEDCLQELQFFDLAESRCRNCSDVMRIFEPATSSDWASLADKNSASNRNEPNGNRNQPSPARARDQEARSGADLIASVIGTRLTPLPAGRQTTSGRRLAGRPPDGPSPAPSAAESVLSRLVLAAQSGSDRTADGRASEADADNQDEADDERREQSDEPASLNANSNVNNGHLEPIQLDENESATPREPEQTNSARLARLWQTLLWSFLRTDELQRLSLDSVEQCRSNQNLSACQMWANICVMAMYSHSTAAFGGQRQPAYSALRLRPLQPQVVSARARSDAARGPRRHSPTTPKTSWQQCPGFNLMTICNSLREWRRREQLPSLDALGDIFGDENVAEGSLPTRLTSGQSAPLKLGQEVQVLAYEYSFDGRLTRVSQFDLDNLSEFCLFSPTATLPPGRMRPDDLEAGRQRILVGQNMKLNCQFSALQANLLAPRHLNQTKFVDLFVGYQLNGAAFVKPVPILLRNLLYQDQLVNMKHAKDPTRWKFVHRYFPLATIKLARPQSERKLDRESREQANSEQDQDQEVLLFARSASFEIKLRRQQDKGLVIGSMLLTLDYDHLPLVRGRRSGGGQRAQAAANGSSSAGVASPKNQIYESLVEVNQILLDMQSYQKDLDLFVTIVCITSTIWTLIKCYNIQKYQGLIKLDVHSLCLFLVIACDIIADLLSLITLAFALFLISLFKLQLLGNQLHAFAPDQPLEQNLLVKLKLALVFKSLGFLYKLTIRLRADVFFIDWERPKMLTSSQIMSQQQQQAASSHSSKQRPGETMSQPASLTSQQVSFWRPYTIINRWLQMQTLRRSDLTLQLVVSLALLKLLKLDQLAASIPSLAHNGAGLKEDPFKPALEPAVSATFRALILALVYLMVATVQIAYRRAVHEPMVKCAVREFVDLCSVANVSLFSMLYPRYGFYVHGRSANGSGDCGLVEMNVLLEREERDLCSRRGLLPNSDQQTFVLVLPKIINDYYRKLLSRLDHTQLGGASSALLLPWSSNRSLKQPAQQPAEFIRSALSLPGSLSPATGQSGSSSFSSMRALVESVVARNRAINTFLINFLDHAYKDIDYSVRQRRRFTSLLMDTDLGDEEAGATQQAAGKFSRDMRNTNNDLGASGRAAGLIGAASQARGDTNQPAATFFVDTHNSFASLTWLGLEWDLIAVELLLLLNIDAALGPELLSLTVSLIWLVDKLLQSVYTVLARKNLIAKSMLDEKFLVHS